MNSANYSRWMKGAAAALLIAAASLSLLVISSGGQAGAAGPAARPYQLKLPLGLDEFALEIPENNPPTVEKVELGRMLFFDKRLSADNTVACATCHAPEKAFTDGKPTSIGIRGQLVPRNSPTVINRVFSQAQFWDGRAPSLEEQAKAPVVSPIEMGMPSHEAMVQKISQLQGYKPLFEKAFGTDKITADHVAQAIASFERTIVSGNSAFDRYEAGGDKNALSESAKRGLELFRTKARCSICHSGFNFTDELYHNLGVGMDKPNPDLGRYNVTKQEKDKGAFKTPTLREITKTAPYMHDGSLKTLEEVIDWYDRGGHKNPWLDPEIKPLNLTVQEKKDLIEFLKSLEGEGWQQIKAPEKLP